MKFNLLFFVRILIRHVWLLVTVPIAFAVLVFLLTKEEPKVYDSKAIIYTAFATGSSIELSDTRLDFKATNIAFENLLNLIKSKNTLETVGLKLFTQHMLLDSSKVQVIGKEKFDALQKIVPQEVKDLVVPGNFEKTYQKFVIYRSKNNANFLNELLSLKHPDYSHAKILEKISVRRISFSDFLDISYQSQDPGICQNTLKILCETFITENADVKANQSDAVVSYFEAQLVETTGRLNRAEQDLLEFNRENLLMNYYEQTKQIAARRENFEGKYQGVLQQNQAAKAVLVQLEKKLGTHEQRRLQHKKVLALRNELADLGYKIAMKSIDISNDSTSRSQSNEAVAELMAVRMDAEARLQQTVDTMFVIDHDKEGLASTSILDDWLEKTISFEGTKAELEVLDQKRLEFDQLTKRYAPLGATMKKLERKINIEEQEYLSLLHSLGLAKLRQQNGELKANLQITDPPFFPLTPNPSKRKMLVIVAGLVGFILVTITVIVMEFLDGNINTAQNAEEKIGLKVSSIFPAINSKDKKIDYEYLKNKAVNNISRNIILNQFKKSDNSEPIINLLFSTQAHEGKTFICENLITKLCELNYNILHITYDQHNMGVTDDYYQKLTYEVSDQLYKIGTVHDFDVDNKIQDFNRFDFVIMELPDIIKNPFPVKLAATMDFSFLVTRANRPWSQADENALTLFKEATTGPEPMVILNGVKVLEMETVVGEIPKKRSAVRRFIKQLVQLRFFKKSKITA